MQKWMLRINDYDGHRLFRWYNEHENARIRETYEIYAMPFWAPEPIRSAGWSVHHEGELSLVRHSAGGIRLFSSTARHGNDATDCGE